MEITEHAKTAAEVYWTEDNSLTLSGVIQKYAIDPAVAELVDALEGCVSAWGSPGNDAQNHEAFDTARARLEKYA